MAQATNGDVLGNINGLGSIGPPAKDNSKEKKGPDTLFGPNIGVISGGPAWTNGTEKKVLKDELTVDVVKSWVEKSKEVLTLIFGTLCVAHQIVITAISTYNHPSGPGQSQTADYSSFSPYSYRGRGSAWSAACSRIRIRL